MEWKRTWMFVPGHRQRMIEKALGLSADAIMLDIEDGAPPNEKDNARKIIAETLSQTSLAGSPARFVRVNAIGHERMEQDLKSVVQPGLHGLVLPKVETVEEVLTAAAMVNQHEKNRGIAAETIKFLVAVESPKGLLNAAALAACCPRIVGLMFGAEDYGRELGLPTARESEARELLYPRASLAVAAAAAHVQSVDGVWVDLNDADGLRRFATQSRRLGFTGMSLIHPSQIDPINTVFSPSISEVEYAQQVLQAFTEAVARGDGSIAFGGQLIDRPIVERARHTLEIAKRLGIGQ
jgi:citrate lyase subunit beta/citryl-CoA lyase